MSFLFQNVGCRRWMCKINWFYQRNDRKCMSMFTLWIANSRSEPHSKHGKWWSRGSVTNDETTWVKLSIKWRHINLKEDIWRISLVNCKQVISLRLCASCKKPRKKNIQVYYRRLARIRFRADSMCWKRPRLPRNVEPYELFEKNIYIRNKCM